MLHRRYTSAQFTEFTRLKHFLSTFKTHLVLFGVMAICLTCLFHVGGSGGTRRRMPGVLPSHTVSGAPEPLNGLYVPPIIRPQKGEDIIWIKNLYTMKTRVQ